MKKLFYFFAVTIAALVTTSLVSCEPTDNPGPNTKPTTAEYFIASTTSMTFPAAGDTRSVRISANREWQATPSVGWITITPTTAEFESAETGTFNVSVGNSELDRTGTITVTDGVNTRFITVKQNASLVGEKLPAAFFLPNLSPTGDTEEFRLYIGQFSKAMMSSRGTGSAFNVTFRAPVVSIGTSSCDIVEGTYDLTGWCTPLVNGNSTSGGNKNIADGTITFKGTSSEYVISIDVTYTSGEKAQAWFIGSLYLLNNNILTSLTDDYDIPELSAGRVTLIDDPANKKSDEWLLEIRTRDIYMAGNSDGVSLKGQGTVLQMTVFSNFDRTLNMIPNGVYELNEIEDGRQTLEPGTSMSGYGSAGNGSWILVFEGDGFLRDRAPLHQGDVRIFSKGEVYTIEVDAWDNEGNKIEGGYTGTLDFSKVAPPTNPNTK